MTNKLEINSLTPVSEVLKEIARKAQHVRFKRRAEIFETSGEVNVLTTAVKKDAKATSQMFGFDTSKTSHHGLFRLLDKATRVISKGHTQVVDDGRKLPFERFDWRTFIFFRFPVDLLIDEIEAYVGGKWVTVDLRNRRFWAAAPQDSKGIKLFVERKQKLTELEKRKKYLSNRRSKGRQILDTTSNHNFTENGIKYELRRLQGTTDKMVDKDGNPIPKERIVQENKQVSLIGDFAIPANGKSPIPSTLADVYKEEAEYMVLTKEINELYDLIRETELSLVEDLFIARMYGEIEEANGNSFEYGSVNFTVKFSDDSDYDFSPDAIEKLKSGEYSFEELPTTPQWRCYELGADVPSTNVEEKQGDSKTVDA